MEKSIVLIGNNVRDERAANCDIFSVYPPNSRVGRSIDSSRRRCNFSQLNRSTFAFHQTGCAPSNISDERANAEQFLRACRISTVCRRPFSTLIRRYRILDFGPVHFRASIDTMLVGSFERLLTRATSRNRCGKLSVD